jgi:6-phosphofructokinase
VFKFQFFSGENYEFWCIKMKTLFVSIDLWDIVKSGYQMPESTSSLTEAQQKELKENKSKDARTLGMIQSGVSETIFPRIMGATRAKEAWDILQEEFQGDKKVRAIKLQTLRRDFENMKMKENESVKDYSTRFLELLNQMKA